ncbi:exported hypothetical protein [metagenome]|uniref:GH26 domain-containing protein n=1 Tax=metagenome TaxID=256318 RepID=A0A2P2CBN5_9ZZZZ
MSAIAWSALCRRPRTHRPQHRRFGTAPATWIPRIVVTTAIVGSLAATTPAEASHAPLASTSTTSDATSVSTTIVSTGATGRTIELALTPTLTRLGQAAGRPGAQVGGTYSVRAKVRANRSVSTRLQLVERTSTATLAAPSLVGTLTSTWTWATLDSTLVATGTQVALTLETYYPKSDAKLSLGDVQVTYTPPAPLPGLGVYNGSPNESPDQTTQASFGAYPDQASTYYQVNQRIDQDYEQARMARGTSPNITITSKGTQYLAGIANGDLVATAWLDRYVSDLRTLALSHPTVPVYATLDHEFRVKVNQGQVTGTSALPAVYGKALSMFFAKADAAAPNIRTTYWFVGYDRAFEGAVGDVFAQAGNADPDYVVFDPYANTASDSIGSITSADISWIKAQPWYLGQPLALGEFGMPVAHGDAALRVFYTDVRQKLRAAGLEWGILFNRERDNNHKITTGAFPQAVAAFGASLRAK